MFIPLIRLQCLPFCRKPLLSSLKGSQLFTLAPKRTKSYLDSSPRSITTPIPAHRMSPDDVLKFWFEDLSPPQWFKTDTALDETISDKFQDILESASACELDGWRSDANGALAEIIVLDQFSRNVYRNTPQAFAQDSLALALAQEAIAKGYDQKLDTNTKRSFLYMPFMHSESYAIHERAMELYSALGGLQFDFEKKHKVIIDRFGRYPHRNQILGRESTPEEETFLKELDSSF